MRVRTITRRQVHAYLKSVFGHQNALADDLETREMLPLHPAMAPLPVNEQMFDEHDCAAP